MLLSIIVNDLLRKEDQTMPVDIERIMKTLNSREAKENELKMLKHHRAERIKNAQEKRKILHLGQEFYGPIDGSGDWQSFMQEGQLIHQLEEELAEEKENKK